MTNKTISSETIELHIEPAAARYTKKGPCYNARLHHPDGEIISCSTEPLFAACRELVKRGITGHVRKYRHGVLSAEGDIEQLAGLTVIENDRGDFYIGKYREYPRADQREGSKTAVLPLQAVRHPGGLSTEIGVLVDS